jgi:hypothetical protein
MMASLDKETSKDMVCERASSCPVARRARRRKTSLRMT